VWRCLRKGPVKAPRLAGPADAAEPAQQDEWSRARSQQWRPTPSVPRVSVRMVRPCHGRVARPCEELLFVQQRASGPLKFGPGVAPGLVMHSRVCPGRVLFADGRWTRVTMCWETPQVGSSGSFVTDRWIAPVHRLTAIYDLGRTMYTLVLETCSAIYGRNIAFSVTH